MRLAWFSPLPPVRSGVAAYSDDLLTRLDRDHTIDRYIDRGAGPQRGFDAHDFVWRHRREPYDLVVYQIGNAPCHDYIWAYQTKYPGLAVLHDARLHHARARSLLNRNRFDDYRAEFRFDHPDAPADVTEYAVEGLGGPIYYLWSMLRVVMSSARLVAVHNARVADDLREAYRPAGVETIRMGVPDLPARPDEAAGLRRAWNVPKSGVIFTAFGKITAEKRIGAIVRAFESLASEGIDAYLLLAGDADGYDSQAGRVRPPIASA
jgi:glycosyltransferase involved in cell wall biosynthesis